MRIFHLLLPGSDIGDLLLLLICQLLTSQDLLLNLLIAFSELLRPGSLLILYLLGIGVLLVLLLLLVTVALVLLLLNHSALLWHAIR